MPKLNPDIMVWARETAGLSVDEAAKRLGLNDSKSSSAVDKLVAIENGDREPTRLQVVAMAEKYRRPLLAFYLSRPPAKAERGVDFRTFRGEPSVRDEALLDALLRDMRARQSMISSILEDEDEDVALTFVGTHEESHEKEVVLASLRELLGVDLDDYRAMRNPGDGFALLRSQAERIGVYVVVQDDLGNYLTAFDTSVFRGFSISDPVAPFIVINGQDARPAWTFTLLHELVHILLGQSGVGNSSIEDENERFCDDIAGNYLLQPGEIQKNNLFEGREFSSVVANVEKFANERNVSRTMVAYNAFRTDLIDDSAYRRLANYFHEQWKGEKEHERARNRGKTGGPNPYVVRRHRTGQSLLMFVRRMIGAGALSTSKAAKILGVKPKQVRTMLETNYGV